MFCLIHLFRLLQPQYGVPRTQKCFCLKMKNSLKLAIALKPAFGCLPELLQLNIYHNWLMFKGLKSRPKNPTSKGFITTFVDTVLPSIVSVRSIHICFSFFIFVISRGLPSGYIHANVCWAWHVYRDVRTIFK